MGAIVWLASYPKSGNTWVRAFLHNLMFDPPEPVPPDRLSALTLGAAQRVHFERARGGSVADMDEAGLAALRPIVHEALTRASPDSVFVKTHAALIETHGAAQHTMDCTAGAVYVVRDPRDVAISMTHHYGCDLDTAIALLAEPEARIGPDAVNIAEPLSTWSGHVESWTARPHPGLCVLRYEDLLARPRAAFGRLARFLGLNPPPARLAKAIRFSSFETLSAIEARDGFKERSAHAARFFREGRAGQWRGLLSAEQGARIAHDHAAQMRRFGYLV